MTPAPRRRRRPTRGAFTLLEVILALVVLAASIAIFGEVMHLANRGAGDARAETQAELLAVTVMDEMLAGYAEVAAVTEQPLAAETDGPWVYSVTISSSQVTGIVPVEVVVQQDLEPEFNPVKYRLTRWVADLPTDAGAAADGSSGTDGGSSNSSTGQTNRSVPL